MQKMKRLASACTLILSLPIICSSVFAAKAIDLNRQNISILHSFASAQALAASGILQLEETKRSVDFRNTLHVRVQETYSGYPVLGADAVIHIPNGANAGTTIAEIAKAAAAQGSMDGTIYQDLKKDLNNAPAIVFTKDQEQKALQAAISTFEHKAGGKSQITEQQSKLVVYVDAMQVAHWAFEVTFYVAPAKAGMMPSKPVMIMDAVNFTPYQQWDNIKTAHLVDAGSAGGGNGGNLKMGKLIYDGGEGNLAGLTVTREDSSQTCFLKNADVTVKSYRDSKVEKFTCAETAAEHNNVYWSGDQDAVNGGYSPANDALFGGAVIKNMYTDWYNVPVLLNSDGTPMMLNMVVHDPIDNAYWDGRQMTFGDGVSMFYPLTSLGVAAHEISHGFTEQHSNLSYWGQSGGMNEAYSDMAAQAAEVYAYGKNSWQIGPEIFKRENEALRYMDKPSKDCNGNPPGSWCSIDDASQYYNGLDVHFSSGVYNHFFYLLGTSTKWTVKKAFDVMVHANQNYWTSNTNFETGACGVLKATKDLGYGVKAVKAAFKEVKIDTSKC